mmetsp:Transcript_48731/g.146847  ORF Transcript_48731/g.146847 Transcript_48731/m.146847 type:complete len:311 (-) Transcript_48731:863-1795(-)|eukprot:CAMPEP_0113549922 /NCGR_PEP_ID=MMETSP0015_2-20120614/13704_1 /TAXON_ID=2838 /ORGANISM="Odontella" /LENGTH=310 /DNA_ID=CAMNT_0000450689 /DNA_START=57 /DNA_END=989 /DNA_ORIENTATION=+ /assembly_acc=CAM_ASM_000160
MSSATEQSNGRADRAVQSIWERHIIWKLIAQRQKTAVVRWRLCALYLSVAGAALQTLSTQLPLPAKSVVSITGGLCIALIPFITNRFLSKEKLQRESRSKVTAEAIKAEVFMFRASVAPYNNVAEDRVVLLLNKVEAITSDMKDLFFLYESQDPGSEKDGPPGPLDRSVSDYIDVRVMKEINGHRNAARRLAKRATFFERIHSFLNSVAAGIGFLAGSTSMYTDGVVPFLVPWGAVATTAAGAVATHIHSAKLVEKSSQLSATAKRLEILKLRLGGDVEPVSQEWTNFVRNCEEAIGAENPKWNAVKHED